MANRLLRKALSAPGLLREVRACFEELDGSDGSGCVERGQGVRRTVKYACAP